MRQAILQLLSGSYILGFKAGTMTKSLEFTFPGDEPAGDSIIKTNSANPNLLEWAPYTASGGGGEGGSVTSIGVNVPAYMFVNGSPVTSAGSITLGFDAQTRNRIFAGPAAADGDPGFRALVDADIPALSAGKIPNLSAGKITSGTLAIARLPTGTTATSVAIGNDSRFHNQNTDTGTTSTGFQLNTSAGGVRLVDDSGVLRLRNSSDNADGDLVVNNLTVRGQMTEITSNIVNTGNAIARYNSDYTGSTPSQDGGFEFWRGTLASAQIFWSELRDRWQTGLSDNLRDIARVNSRTFTSADLVGGKLTFVHGLRRKPVSWAVWMDDGNGVLVQPKANNDNEIEFDFTGLTVSNTWEVVVTG